MVFASCHTANSSRLSRMRERPRIAIVIPCYRVRDKIVEVVASVVPIADAIFAVDDCCPEKSGEFLRENCADPKVTVLFHEKNQGVGGAMVTGFKAALEAGA